MGKGRVTALLLAVVVIGGVALMRTATANHTSDHQAFSGGAGFKGLVVKTDGAQTLITTVDPTWTTVDSRGFQIPAGESQLIVVDFFAETICAGTGFNWCSARVLAGRTLATAEEMEPAVGVDFAIDSVANEGPEGHAMSRAVCVRNATGSPVNIGVWLQATRSTGDVGTFSLDDWTLKIARNAPCSPFVDI